jgi:hypothetical protein
MFLKSALFSLSPLSLVDLSPIQPIIDGNIGLVEINEEIMFMIERFISLSSLFSSKKIYLFVHTVNKFCTR